MIRARKHRCVYAEGLRWKKGSLFNAKVDYQLALYNLHRKCVPTNILRQRAEDFVQALLLNSDEAGAILRNIELERGMSRVANNRDASDEEEGITALDGRLTIEELAAKLQEREANMQSGAGDGLMDQWRVYRDVTSKIERGEYVRMLVQASAGTGFEYTKL